MTNRVFLIGAGFSRAISESMPLAVNLGKHLVDKLRPNLTRGEWSTVHYENWLTRLATEQPDLSREENLANQLDFEKATREIHSHLSSLQLQIQLDVSDVQWIYQFVRLCHLYRATILTLNYDTLIEQVVNRSGIYKGSEIGNSIFACDCMGWQLRTYGIDSNPVRDTLQLLKLHGSARLAICF